MGQRGLLLIMLGIALGLIMIAIVLGLKNAFMG